MICYGLDFKFYDTEERPLTYIALRSEVEGDVVEVDRNNWFEKVEERERQIPFFQNLSEPTRN